MNLAEIIKNARKNRQLTLREASRLTRLSVSLLHAVETGSQPRPKMETLYKLSAFYNIPIDTICISATRIPQDVFYEIIRCPKWLEEIRKHKGA